MAPFVCNRRNDPALIPHSFKRGNIFAHRVIGMICYRNNILHFFAFFVNCFIRICPTFDAAIYRLKCCDGQRRRAFDDIKPVLLIEGDVFLFFGNQE